MADDEDPNAPTEPKDATAIRSILASMGVREYEPRVVVQLLEFGQRYVSQVFQDARAYADHADKETIDLDDVRLSIQSRVTGSFTHPPPREFFLDLAEKKNSLPLPLLPTEYGVRLPPEDLCLTAPNFQLRSLDDVRAAKEAERERIAAAAPTSPRRTGNRNVKRTPQIKITMSKQNDGL